MEICSLMDLLDATIKSVREDQFGTVYIELESKSKEIRFALRANGLVVHKEEVKKEKKPKTKTKAKPKRTTKPKNKQEKKIESEPVKNEKG